MEELALLTEQDKIIRAKFVSGYYNKCVSRIKQLKGSDTKVALYPEKLFGGQALRVVQGKSGISSKIPGENVSKSQQQRQSNGMALLWRLACGSHPTYMLFRKLGKC